MNQKRQKITLEMLSAYLDNQLSEKDRIKVESALQINPALKQDLSMLDATRRLLRNAPTLKVPRNFTLSASMVTKQNPFKFWMPAMSFSSALAAVLFALSFIFNFSPVGSSLTAQTRNMEFTASDSISADIMEMDDTSVKSAAEEPPVIIQWFGEQANGMGGGGPAAEAAEGTLMAEEAAPMVAEAPAYDMEAESEMSAMGEAVGAAADSAMSEMPAEEPAPVMEEALPAAKDGPQTDSDGGFNTSGEDATNLILGVSPVEERGQIIEEPQQIMPQTYTEERQPANQNSTILAILRGGLLLLSITFAIIAFLMHRQRA